MIRLLFSGLLALALVVGFAAPSRAGWDEAEAAYDRGDYVTAFHEFHVLAQQGDAHAQYSLGYMYGEGEGVPQDDAGAARW